MRAQIAVVAQDTFLFTGSIRENLLLAKPHAKDAELRAAIALAGLTEFITALPQGFDTTVGERGAPLSGGERQRIAIARAALKNAPILIRDEATSHLDAVNERRVRDALERLKRERRDVIVATIIIAHRLSTVKDADAIIVLEHGRVVERDTCGTRLARGSVRAAGGSAVARGGAYDKLMNLSYL